MSSSPRIPKLVHQTWKTSEVPAHWKSSYDAWTSDAMKQHGWSHRLWTDADNRQLIQDKFPWFLSVYDGYKHPIQRADAVRPFILFTYGGVYCDLDIEPKVPEFDAWFETVCHHPLVLSEARQEGGMGSGHVTNAWMASVSGHPFWALVWTYFLHPTRRVREKGFLMKLNYHFDTLFRTGPGIVTDAAHEYQEKEQTHIYTAPWKLLQPFEDPSRPPPPESLVRILKGSSWHNKNRVDLYRMARAASNHLEWIIGSVVVLALVLAAYMYTRYRDCKRRKAKRSRPDRSALTDTIVIDSE
jgi:mannosyltransferase OCH1-like enzyme